MTVEKVRQLELFLNNERRSLFVDGTIFREYVGTVNEAIAYFDKELKAAGFVAPRRNSWVLSDRGTLVVGTRRQLTRADVEGFLAKIGQKYDGHTNVTINQSNHTVFVKNGDSISWSD
ncbi:hypothetical protein ACFQS3_02345 [Glycomyces mayteni]|uniref:Uncharacterized protein n=1 Tax=Glycomyces mayteni TaxID=543887 RepID=A0ABW2D3E5_9ACTN